MLYFFFSSRRRHTRCGRDWSSDVCSSDLRIGHHPDFPVGHNWLALRDELLHTLESFDAPVIGVGHSMGGVLMAMAAEASPERFRCVVMLDPPLIIGRAHV